MATATQTFIPKTEKKSTIIRDAEEILRRHEKDLLKDLGRKGGRVKEENVLGFSPIKIKTITDIADMLSKLEEPLVDLMREDSYAVKRIFWEYEARVRLEEKIRYGNGWPSDQEKARLGYLRKTCANPVIFDLLSRVCSVRGEHGENANDALAVGFAYAISREGSTLPLAGVLAIEFFVDLNKLSKPATEHLAFAAEWAQVQAAFLICEHERVDITCLAGRLRDSLVKLHYEKFGGFGVGMRKFMIGDDFLGTGSGGPPSPRGYTESGPGGASTSNPFPLGSTEYAILCMIGDMAYSKDKNVANALDDYGPFKFLNLSTALSRYIGPEMAWRIAQDACKQKRWLSPQEYDATLTQPLPDNHLSDMAYDLLRLEATPEQRFNAIVTAIRGNWRLSGTAALVAPMFINVNELDADQRISLRSAIDEAAEKTAQVTYLPVRAFCSGSYINLKNQIPLVQLP